MRHLQAIILFSIVLTSSTDPTTIDICPDGWAVSVLQPKLCYKFVQVAVTKENAETYCPQTVHNSSHLTILPTELDWTSFLNLMVHCITLDVFWWMSIKYNNQEEDLGYYWSDGTRLDYGVKWYSNQSIDTNPCASIGYWWNKDGQWYPNDCNVSLAYFACQITLTEPANITTNTTCNFLSSSSGYKTLSFQDEVTTINPSKSQTPISGINVCPDGWSVSALQPQNCYRFFLPPYLPLKTKNDSSDYCKSNVHPNSTLLSLKTEMAWAAYTSLTQLCLPDNTEFWLDIAYNSVNQMNYWSDGTPLPYAPYWSIPTSSAIPCATTFGYTSGSGMIWKAEYCYLTHQTMCQLVLSEPAIIAETTCSYGSPQTSVHECPGGFAVSVLQPTLCYFIVTTQLVSKDNAETFCPQLVHPASRLTILRTEQEWSAFLFLTQKCLPTVFDLWLSINYYANATPPGHYWGDGTYLNYDVPFFTDLPFSSYPCIRLEDWFYGGAWKQDICSTLYGFVCQIRLTEPTVVTAVDTCNYNSSAAAFKTAEATTVAPIITNDTIALPGINICPDGWSVSMSRPQLCFMFFYPNNPPILSKDQASSYCRNNVSQVSTLVILKSQLDLAAYMILAELCISDANSGTDSWLDLTHDVATQTFSWVDGTPLTYNPSFALNDTNVDVTICGWNYGMQWYTRPGSGFYRTVCQLLLTQPSLETKTVCNKATPSTTSLATTTTTFVSLSTTSVLQNVTVVSSTTTVALSNANFVLQNTTSTIDLPTASVLPSANAVISTRATDKLSPTTVVLSNATVASPIATSLPKSATMKSASTPVASSAATIATSSAATIATSSAATIATSSAATIATSTIELPTTTDGDNETRMEVDRELTTVTPLTTTVISQKATKSNDTKPQNPMSAVQQLIATVTQVSGCLWIIGTTASAVVFVELFQSSSYERLLHLGQELTILLAHIVMLLLSAQVDNKIACHTSAIALQYLFMSSFFFFFFEALQTYCLHTQVIPFGSVLSKLKTLIICCGLPAIITFLTSVGNLSKLGSSFACWLNFDSHVAYGTVIPILVISIITFILIEATSMGHYPILPMTSKAQFLASEISRHALTVNFPLHVASWILSALAMHYQRFELFSTCFGINVAFAWKILFSHLLGNDQVIQKTKKVFQHARKKICG